MLEKERRKLRKCRRKVGERRDDKKIPEKEEER